LIWKTYLQHNFTLLFHLQFFPWYIKSFIKTLDYWKLYYPCFIFILLKNSLTDFYLDSEFSMKNTHITAQFARITSKSRYPVSRQRDRRRPERHARPVQSRHSIQTLTIVRQRHLRVEHWCGKRQLKSLIKWRFLNCLSFWIKSRNFSLLHNKFNTDGREIIYVFLTSKYYLMKSLQFIYISWDKWFTMEIIDLVMLFWTIIKETTKIWSYINYSTLFKNICS